MSSTDRPHINPTQESWVEGFGLKRGRCWGYVVCWTF